MRKGTIDVYEQFQIRYSKRDENVVNLPQLLPTERFWYQPRPQKIIAFRTKHFPKNYHIQLIPYYQKLLNTELLTKGFNVPKRRQLTGTNEALTSMCVEVKLTRNLDSLPTKSAIGQERMLSSREKHCLSLKLNCKRLAVSKLGKK
ncbi:hypothetical protein ILUMI_12704 [Ignelater luminosus]|uniref:Uncharacterized protein n=1 Tax=Ignelater luminosus TaxID=2038154 RepID=A0A8K0CTS7_IGNLU|nr:hypothetical protein ILUMI_12704 [Ignelater luminosus]